MKYYAVIDTNVIVSAYLHWNSVPGNLMDAVFDGRIIPVISGEIEEERKTEDAFFVTGNQKHFPVRPFIITPRQMMDVLMGR